MRTPRLTTRTALAVVGAVAFGVLLGAILAVVSPPALADRSPQRDLAWRPIASLVLDATTGVARGPVLEPLSGDVLRVDVPVACGVEKLAFDERSLGGVHATYLSQERDSSGRTLRVYFELDGGRAVAVRAIDLRVVARTPRGCLLEFAEARRPPLHSVAGARAEAPTQADCVEAKDALATSYGALITSIGLGAEHGECAVSIGFKSALARRSFGADGAFVFVSRATSRTVRVPVVAFPETPTDS